MHCVSYTEVKLVRYLIIKTLQIYIKIFLCFKKHGKKGKYLKLCKNCGILNTLATRNLVLQYISQSFSNNQLISMVWFSVQVETFRDGDLVYKTEWRSEKVPTTLHCFALAPVETTFRVTFKMVTKFLYLTTTKGI